MDSQPGGVEILLCRCLHSSLCAMEKVGMNNEDQQSMEMEGRPLLWQPWMRCWSSRRGCTRGDGAPLSLAATADWPSCRICIHGVARSHGLGWSRQPDTRRVAKVLQRTRRAVALTGAGCVRVLHQPPCAVATCERCGWSMRGATIIKAGRGVS
jgi:hypothetical protein